MSQRFLEEGSDKLDVDAFVPGSFGLRTRTRLADIGKEGGSAALFHMTVEGFIKATLIQMRPLHLCLLHQSVRRVSRGY